MSFFNKSKPKVIYMTEDPAFYQSDGSKVNPIMKKYIIRGEPCEYDTRFQKSFESRTNESVSKIIMMIVGFFVAVIYVILSVLNDRLKDPLSLILIILACFLAYIFYCLHRNKIDLLALNAAKRGDIRCYGYKVYNILQCHTSCNTNDSFYADLGDFCVCIPDNCLPEENVCGAVVTINGEEYFYLLR
ncbi:MAG: hypothetical protein ACI4JK_03070 [Oscillospiraceae bacterium]